MPAGRPSKFTDETLQKLEYAFALGCTDLEACFYADISKSALYNYQEKNPDFVERKELLKEKPVLQARQAVIESLESDSRLAFDYLKNKKSDEFSTKVNNELSGALTLSDQLAQLDDPTEEDLRQCEAVSAQK